MNQMTTAPLQPAPISARVAFTGDRRSFLGLVARGAGLEMITAGFYRFWLTTDIRRHLWSHTVVDGDGAEYTGRGRELLIGFLVAMAILVPIYIAYFILGLEAERLQAFASIPLVLLLYVFTQFAIYRARRYRMTRTVWRGVRFWMTGSGWSYALRATLWGAAMVLTLGLILPWRDAALERYKMRNTHYGDLQGSFEGRGWEFFKRGWWLWLLTPVALVTYVGIPFVYGAFKAIQMRWWLSGLRLGGVRLESNLGAGQLMGLYWKTIGWTLLISIGLIAYMAFAAVMAATMTGHPLDTTLFSNLDLLTSVPFIAFAVVGYLAWAMVLNIFIRLYLMRDLWQRAVSSITVHGIETAANVSAKGDLASAIGEGFADGLDVGGF
ncbi:DUF898 family protein [Bradyrhizobium sp. LHD-71]|uniref:DUF898 family protein n=1 Tax=Bradyrhizobium sp. LHD-71 TaxID=3072141 RepID=UPI00280CEFF2|nr:DUF898 family protein [Bradyrhizobium sp. LHD-71]MDQ8732390.1 DUF898 family protein [Bradyrhizobium sp. LHD-71]